MLAVFFVVAIPADPAHAAPDWKGAVAVIAEIRDAAIDDLLDLVADYQDYLAGGPSSEEAAGELAETKADMEQVAAEAGEDIRSVMNDYPGSSQVQDAGVFALGLVGLARNYAIDQATLDYNEFLDGLPPSTTTTTLPVTTTTLPVTTTTVPVTTTTLPVTTSTVPVSTTTVTVTTTTTLPGTTTTTSPTTTTTTTTRPPTTTTRPQSTTTTTTAGASTTSDRGGEPPVSPGDGGPTGSTAPAGGGQDLLEGGGPLPIEDSQLLGEARLSSSFFSDSPGLTDSLTRILEPVLPTAVAEMVVSPLLIFELLWRAISSSGRGLVMPMSLLTFSLISMLWDRRSKRVPIAT